MNITELATPCYIYDKAAFQDNVRLFQEALEQFFPNQWILGYSFKTNSLPALLEDARTCGCFAEVVSETEYRLAERLGYSRNRMIYNGPIKSKASFTEVLCAGGIINIDSEQEIAWLEEMDAQGIIGSVGIRVNFDVESRLPGQTMMGQDGGRFGFCEENGALSLAIKRLSKLSGISLCGLHMHISSRSKSLEVFQVLAEEACEIAQKEGLHLSYIDIGGGFFGGGDDGKAYRTYVQTIHSIFTSYGMKDTILICEPGASLVASCFDYYTKVLEVKDTIRNRFVVTDGSRLHIDPFFRKNKYSFTTDSIADKYAHKQVIVGYSCMENDRIMEFHNGPELVPGDHITYHVVGSYTMCFNSLFIRYLPVVYCQENGTYRIVRNIWGVDEYTQGNLWGKNYEEHTDSKCRNTQQAGSVFQKGITRKSTSNRY